MERPEDQYIERVEEACGKGGDFIIMIKHAKADEFLEKALHSGQVLYSMPGVMVRTKVSGKEVSVLRTGRVLVKDAGSVEDARAILREMIST